jgi:hypothetical protein
MRFLGLGFADKIPDAKTVWLHTEQKSNIEKTEKERRKGGRDDKEKGKREERAGELWAFVACLWMKLP